MCRWDARRLDFDIAEVLGGREPMAVCPEMEGGLPCPRPKAEIKDGDGADVLDSESHVIDDSGCDVTFHFLTGARAALDLALKNDIALAIFKEKSPSCGVRNIYRKGRLVQGSGVTTALLRRHGIEVRGYGA